MTTVWRQDKLQLDAKGVDPDTGFLTGRVTLAKVGVYPYLQADGSVRHEYVPPETLADKDWLASCEMAPVTLLHPPEPVCAQNVATYQVGALGEQVVAKSDANESRLRVYRSDGVEAVKAGVQEASCGYTCVLVHTPGEYQGQKYDAVQTARRMNHRRQRSPTLFVRPHAQSLLALAPAVRFCRLGDARLRIDLLAAGVWQESDGQVQCYPAEPLETIRVQLYGPAHLWCDVLACAPLARRVGLRTFGATYCIRSA